MFVLVGQRSEFRDKWMPVLSCRGEILEADGLPGLQARLAGGAASLVVLDRGMLGEMAPGFLSLLVRLCGPASLLLGDTRYDAAGELAALATGVAACCDASLAEPELSRILGIVLEGGLWISPLAMPLFASRMQVATDPPGRDAASLDVLTDRQRDVALLVAQGVSNKEIARRLAIAERTVKTHLTAIFDRLDIADRLQLALYVNNRSGR